MNRMIVNRRRGDLLLVALGVRIIWWAPERMPTRHVRRAWALAPALVVDVGRVGVRIRFGRGLLDSDRPEWPTSTLRHVQLGPLHLTFRKGPGMRGCAR